MSYMINGKTLYFANEGSGDFDGGVNTPRLEQPGGLSSQEAIKPQSPLEQDMVGRLEAANERLSSAQVSYDRYNERGRLGKAVHGFLNGNPARDFETTRTEVGALKNVVDALQNGNDVPAKALLTTELESEVLRGIGIIRFGNRVLDGDSPSYDLYHYTAQDLLSLHELSPGRAESLAERFRKVGGEISFPEISKEPTLQPTKAPHLKLVK